MGRREWCRAFDPQRSHVARDQSRLQLWVRVWNAENGAELLTISSKDNYLRGPFSHDGRRIVTTGPDKVARIWDAGSGLELKRISHDAPVISAAFSPDGRRIVTGMVDKTARVWDAELGVELRRFTGP